MKKIANLITPLLLLISQPAFPYSLDCTQVGHNKTSLHQCLLEKTILNNIQRLKDENHTKKKSYLKAATFLCDGIQKNGSYMTKLKDKKINKRPERKCMSDIKQSWDTDMEIITAVRYKDRDAVIQLIKDGSDIETHINGRTLLIMAAANNDNEMMKLLLNTGAKVNAYNKDGKNALWYAIRSKNIEAIKLLISLHINVNKSNNSGETPLMLAVNTKQANVVDLLLQAQAKVNMKDARGKSALMGLGARSDIKITKMLLDAGADVNAKSKLGATPLINASHAGNIQILRLMLNSGAKINERSFVYDTPLTAAARNGDPKVIQFLIDNGADIHAKDGRKYTALEVCEELGHEEAAKILRQAMM